MPPSASHPVLEHLAANIRRLRLKQGLRQRDLADAIGVDERYVRRIEAADVNVTVVTLARLAEVLRTTPGRLVRKSEAVQRRAGRPAKRKKR